MKRSISSAEIPVLRPLVPDTVDNQAPAVEPAANEPALAPSAESNATEYAPMAFPGPFAFVPRPTAMEDGNMDPGSASSASTGRDGSGETVVGPGFLAAAQSQPYSETAPAAGGSSIAVAGAVITHPTAGDDNPHGYPPPILAAVKGRLAELELLLKDPALNIDRLDQGCGMNPLIAASLFNKPEVVVYLLAAGAKVNVVSYRYRATALMLAAKNGHIDVVKALLTRENVALDLPNADGFNALALAAGRNHPDVVKCLLAAGAAVNLACGPLRQTALGDAAYRGYVEVVKTLLASPQVAIDATNVDGQSPLHVAARFGKADVAACLLEAGASMTITTADGDKAIHLAIQEKHAAVVEVLLQHGPIVLNYDFIDTNAEPSAVAFFVTLADLVADLKSPADLEFNPLGLIAPDSLDDPVAIIDRVIKWFAEFKDLMRAGYLYDAKLPNQRDQVTRALQRKLYKDGIRAACMVPVGECLASFLEVWPLFTDKEGKTNEKQMQLVCAAGLGRLSAISANESALRHYKAAGISAEGIARLSAVATRQIDRLIALSEELLTTAGSDMLEGLMPACLFRTGLKNAVDTETLIAELYSARWLKPLAQTIVKSWEAALAALGAEPVPIPAGSTLNQITQLLGEHVEREAPLRFKQALQKELAAHTLLEAKRTWQEKTWRERRWNFQGPESEFKMLTHEGVELLFQIQCDQLRQYCEQTGRAD